MSRHGQHPVANLVAERIVDLLESIEIKEQHFGAGAGESRRLQRFCKSHFEGMAVSQTGDGVEMRHMVDCAIGVSLVGHVLQHDDPTAGCIRFDRQIADGPVGGLNLQ